MAYTESAVAARLDVTQTWLEEAMRADPNCGRPPHCQFVDIFDGHVPTPRDWESGTEGRPLHRTAEDVFWSCTPLGKLSEYTAMMVNGKTYALCRAHWITASQCNHRREERREAERKRRAIEAHRLTSAGRMHGGFMRGKCITCGPVTLVRHIEGWACRNAPLL